MGLSEWSCFKKCSESDSEKPINVLIHPVDLILVRRALGLLDGVTKQLDPDINALEIVASYIPEMATDHL